MNKIFLMGYMGSGKSTIGKILANKVNFNWIDLDLLIEKKEGLPVKDIFKFKGELYFRKLENQVLIELLNSDENCIVSLGGGTPCYSNNIELLKKDAYTTIYLKRSIEYLSKKLHSKKNERPLIADKNEYELNDFIAKALFERSFFYNQSKYIINGDNKSKVEIANEIINLIQL